MREDYKRIVKSLCVVKAYIDKSGKFLKIENQLGTIITINEHRYGDYELYTPIVSNIDTGSSIGVTEHDEPVSVLEVIAIIRKQTNSIPSWLCSQSVSCCGHDCYLRKQKIPVFFESIEKAIAQHGNILQFKQIN